MKIYQSRSFERKVKKFNKKEKNDLDDEIKKIIGNQRRYPRLGPPVKLSLDA